MAKHLVLVGGGHAHMMTLENISKFVAKEYKVTVIGPSTHHYYSGMGPGMLGGTYSQNDIRFATKEVVLNQGGHFIQDKVVKIDPDKREVFTLAGQTFSYDVLSFNAGSYVPNKTVHESGEFIYPVKPIEKLQEAAEKLATLFISKQINVAIVGGGPSSAEIAGNVWQLAKKTDKQIPNISIFAGRKFMAKFPATVRSKVLSSLKKRGIRIYEGSYVEKITASEIRLESGKTFSTDFVFVALGVKPSQIFTKSGLPVGGDEGLLVNKFLQSIKYPEIFGGGDCICFQDQPLDKVGVYAVRENPILLHNLMASLDGGQLQEFKPGPEYLLIFNIGGGYGVFKKNRVVFGGRLAFLIKDYIDRKFMRRFQAIENS